MKTLFFVSAMFLNGFFTPVHDVPIAFFTITESEGILELDITFDVEDFSKSLSIQPSEIKLEAVKNYLEQNTRFQFNDQQAQLNITEVKIVRDHVKVKGNLGKTKGHIPTIKIENTCLNNIFRHSNVIQIDLNNMSRDFRMNKRRTEIKVEY